MVDSTTCHCQNSFATLGVSVDGVAVGELTLEVIFKAVALKLYSLNMICVSLHIAPFGASSLTMSVPRHAITLRSSWKARSRMGRARSWVMLERL